MGLARKAMAFVRRDFSNHISYRFAFVSGLAGVFSSTSLGLFSGYGFAEGITTIGGQVMVQFIGVIATVVFTGVVSYLLFKLVDKLIGLRVSRDQEIEGLDIALHEERGYNELG